MKAGTMEGLIGAGINMKMVDTPMRVYKEARRKGDLGAMERAMGYASEFQDTAYDYKEKAEKELRKEMEENREEQQREREEALAERQKETKEAQKETVEKLADKAEELRNENERPLNTLKSPQADSLVISTEGNKLLAENRPNPDAIGSVGESPDVEAPDIPSNTDSKSAVKLYSSAGTGVEPAPIGGNVSVGL